MADQPDYTKHNPLAIMGEANLAAKKGPRLRIFKQDGSPDPYVEPTDEELQAFISAFGAQHHNVDMRKLVYLVAQLQENLQGALLQCLSTAHMIAHHPNYNKGYDEDKLCDGISAYLDINEDDKTQVTAENSHEVLEPFFTEGKKPN